MSPKYRGEKWSISYGAESSYGAVPTGTTTATHIFGVFEDATLPDPEYDHTPYWMFKTTAPDREAYIMYRGKARYSGSIPNIVLLDAKPIYLAFADAITHAGADPYSHSFPGAAGGTTALPSFRIITSYYDDTGAVGLKRFWSGGKVNRATLSIEEGGMLTMSLDEILFRDVYFKNDDTLLTPFYDTDVAAQALTYPTREPFYFSECEVNMKLVQYINATTATLTEVTIPSVRSFRLEVNNNLTPKYYLRQEGASGAGDVHGPYEIIEGRQEFRISLRVDLSDFSTEFNKDDLFLNLLRQGRETASSAYTAVKGIGMRIAFLRANDPSDRIYLYLPSNYVPAVGGEAQGGLIIRAPHNIVTEDLVSVPVEIIGRNIGVSIQDHINGTTYPDQTKT